MRVLSRYNFLSKETKPFMTTLSDRKVSWIYKQFDLGKLSIGEMARVAKVSPRRIRQLREYRTITGRKF
jgi:hypothetical protein